MGGLFGLLKRVSIDDGVSEFRETNNAVLIDVRTRDEYSQGYIKGSFNIPLDELISIEVKVPDKNTPLFVHCASGARSERAAAQLKQMGYVHVKNIGGIMNYKGKVEKQ